MFDIALTALHGEIAIKHWIKTFLGHRRNGSLGFQQNGRGRMTVNNVNRKTNMNKMINKNRNVATDRRRFVTALVGSSAMGALPVAGLGWSVAASAQSGQPYKLIEPAMPTKESTGVEVLEFFWFGCPHCYAFEPAINEWAESKPDYVNFVREAPPLNPSWEQHSRTYYAAQALGIEDSMFDQMFDQIHKQRKPMRKPERIGEFIESLDVGVSAAEFIKTMDSFTVNTAIERSMQRAQQAGIQAVPSVVINGKYLTGNTLAGSHQGIIDVINELAAKEHEDA